MRRSETISWRHEGWFNWNEEFTNMERDSTSSGSGALRLGRLSFMDGDEVDGPAGKEAGTIGMRIRPVGMIPVMRKRKLASRRRATLERRMA